MRFSLSSCLCAVLGLAAVALSASPGVARTWKPSAQGLAQDYLLINDSRPTGDVVVLLWPAPPMLDDKARLTAQILDQYFVLGVVHARIAPGTGAFTFITSDAAPVVVDGTAAPMKAVDAKALPATVTGVLTQMQAEFAQGLGAFGKGIEWHTYTGAAHACAKGKVSVKYAGETYIYDTPIPGCPKG